jgi:predicted nuclease with TOPRIM domain
VADLDARLDAAIKRRDSLAADCKRIEGHFEAAKASLASVEAECRAKKIDPDRIDELLTQAEKRFETLVTELEGQVEAAAKALAPYTQQETGR